jgi:predicted nucleic acid-binding protein
LTQNGCLRILSQPAYPGAQPLAMVAERLSEATADASHAFWPDSLSLLDRSRINWSNLTGHRQVTDVYLLALALHNGGRFVTFDARISPATVAKARPEQLVVLGRSPENVF